MGRDILKEVVCMKRMVRGCAVVMAVALSLSAALGVSAGDKAKLTSSGNKTTVVTDFSQEGIKLSLNGKNKPEGVLEITSSDKGVQLKAAANFNASFESIARVQFGETDKESDKNLEGIVYDWSDAIAFDVTVDASAYTKKVSFLAGIMGSQVKDGKAEGVWMEPAAGAKVYAQADGSSEWKELTASAKRTIELDAGFKGTVRVSLMKGDLGMGPWTAEGVRDDVSAYLSHVPTVYFSVSGDTQPVYVQKVSFVTYGAAAGGNGGNNGGASTDKTPGATTGEAFPALALVMIPAAGVVLAVARKKSK